jgi:hypothetical protein
MLGKRSAYEIRLQAFIDHAKQQEEHEKMSEADRVEQCVRAAERAREAEKARLLALEHASKGREYTSISSAASSAQIPVIPLRHEDNAPKDPSASKPPHNIHPGSTLSSNGKTRLLRC